MIMKKKKDVSEVRVGRKWSVKNEHEQRQVKKGGGKGDNRRMFGR